MCIFFQRQMRKLAALSPFTILLSLLSSTLSDEDIDSFQPNHLYTDSAIPASQTPRNQPIFNNFPQRIPLQKIQHQRFQPIRARNLTNYQPTPPTIYNFFPQPSKLSKVKRSQDYHYGNMDYHQYEVDDHEPLYHPHMPHMTHMPAIRTTHFPRIPMFEKPEPKLDISTLGMLALMKLGMLKMMKFGFINMILMMLFKMPMILGILGMKFMILMNLVKLAKLLTLPLILPLILLLLIPILIPLFLLLIPLLLPLILAPLIPLILIPILLPLLLLLPVPVLAPVTGRRRRQLEDSRARSVDEDVLYLVRRVLESEQCIERVACRLAANKQSKGFTAFVAWYVNF